jgi:hypothetical protein
VSSIFKLPKCCRNSCHISLSCENKIELMMKTFVSTIKEIFCYFAVI